MATFFVDNSAIGLSTAAFAMLTAYIYTYYMLRYPLDAFAE